MTDQDTETPVLGAAPHELTAYLHFTAHEETPYWALKRFVQHVDGGTSDVEFEVGGEPWEVSLGYEPSGLAPRESDPVESLQEYKVTVDGPREKGARFEAKPRWNDPDADGHAMRTISEDSPESPVPPGMDGAVSVFTQGSNLPLDAYPKLLVEGLVALADATGFDWNRQYFREADGSGRILAHERYVRVHRDRSRAIVAQNGPMWRIWRLLCDQRGTRMEGEANNTNYGDGPNIEGYRHQLRLNRRAANELLPSPQRGKQFKHYHRKHARASAEGDDPLDHPKFGVLFKKKWNDREAVPWSDRDDLVAELETNLVNVLSWAGLPTVPDPTTYVVDDHFEPGPSPRDVALFDDPTPEIEADQETAVVRALCGTTENGVAMLDELAADGGALGVDELAAEVECSTRTIYRRLKDMADLVTTDTEGEGVRLLGERIREAVESVTADLNRAADRLRDLGRLGNGDSAAVVAQEINRWCWSDGVEIKNREGQGRLRLVVDEVADTLSVTDCRHVVPILRRGLEHWMRAGLEGEQFLEGEVEYREPQPRGEPQPRATLVKSLLDDDRRAPVR